MDKKGWRSLAVACLVLGMVLGVQSTASFKSCYESCFILCLITPNHSIASCTFQCFKDCIIPTTSLHKDTQYFCKLGCASSLCSNFSTKQNPEVEKVDGCVDSCSETCTKAASPPKRN